MADKTDKDKDADGHNRADPRYPAGVLSGITSMRLSPGDAVRLVNMSASGVLVEGKTRFVPGTRVSVIFEGPTAPPAVKGRIVRCQVSAIGGGGSLQYRSAIAFEARVELAVDETSLPQAPAPVPQPVPKASKKDKDAPAAQLVPAGNRW